MSKLQGPALTVEASCLGCTWVHEEHYAIQGDAGCNVWCQNPAVNGYVGDTTWRTPEWCPLLAEAKRRLAVTLANDRQVL